MWRNQARFSSNLFLSKSNPNPNPFISPSSPNPLELHKRGYLLSHLHSSTGRLPLSPNPSFGRERAYGFSSSATIPGSPALSYASVSAAGNVPDALRHYGRCYWELSKAKLSMLVVATSGAGFVLGSGTAIDFAGLCWTCTGTMMVAASANSLNQIFEKYNDAKMKRTRKRPLPSGRLSIPHAAIWASSVGVAGTILLACKANILAAGLGASTLALYAFVYTPLKQIHPINTWVGAIVGAIPPALGWAAASGQISLDGMILPAALYFWQIPHFMALAYLCRDDYAAGGFRMFSLADVSGHRTALVAFRNSLYLLPLGFLAYDWGITSGWFCLESGALTLAIAATAYSFYKNPTVKSARKMFHASLLYLPVFMSGLMVHRLTDNHQEVSETNTRTFSALPSLEIESDYHRKNQRKVSSMDIQARPPVAYASVAPFPFLPVPVYADSEL